MKTLGMFFVVSLATCAMAMDDQSNKNQKIENTLTLKGTIASNETGHLECKVTFNPTTNTYSGKLTNHRYAKTEWHSMELDTIEAQQYYQQLLQLSKTNQTQL